MKSKTLLFLALLFPGALLSQGIDVPPRHIIDMPTAGLLRRGGFDLNVRFYGHSGVNLGINVGISPRFMFGVSFGGTEVLGEEEANWNPAPGVLVRYRILGESIGLPAVTLGFESQGYGAYLDSTERYVNKSPGFYAVASKSYDLLQRLDFHAGINYSLEKNDGDKDMNFFLGSTLAINPDIEFLVEYDLAINDSPEKMRTLGDGKGYLNAGLRLNLERIVYLEFYFKNLFENRTSAPTYTREIKITYFQFIM